MLRLPMDIDSQHPIWCLDCDYPLIGLQSSLCPECGRAFDLDDDRTYRGILFRPFVITTLSSQLDASLLQSDLQDVGVRVSILTPNLVMAELGGLNVFSILVTEADVPKAQPIVNQFLQDKKESPATKVENLPDWECRHCGEGNGGAFEVCWNCQMPPS